jgi:sRNA-binding regulator protein Hfq
VKKSLFVFSIVTILSQSIIAEGIKQQDLSVEEMQKQKREIVKLSSEEISKTLPQTVDKYTVLTKVEGKENTMVYTFEINTGAKSDEAVKKEDRARMKKAVTTGICQSSKRFIDAQINISYIYIGAKSKAELFRFDVTQADCPVNFR